MTPRIGAALSALLPASQEIDATVDHFAADLSDYAELITHPGEPVAGFMTRGDDPGFTERVANTLTRLGISDEARAHHHRLASWFQHRRAFFKVEWHATPDGRAPRPLAACYFRRRPPIADVQLRLSVAGVDDTVLTAVGEIAALLDKQTVHFVSAAFRPDHPVRHKLYFSQHLIDDTRARVAHRIEGLFDRYGTHATLRDRWRAQHPRTLPSGETTLFISISFDATALVPSFKIDYPTVPATRAALWVQSSARAAVLDAADRACALAGTHDITYLGVRFDTAAPNAIVKLYCDPPPASAAR